MRQLECQCYHGMRQLEYQCYHDMRQLEYRCSICLGTRFHRPCRATSLVCVAFYRDHHELYVVVVVGSDCGGVSRCCTWLLVSLLMLTVMTTFTHDAVELLWSLAFFFSLHRPASPNPSPITPQRFVRAFPRSLTPPPRLPDRRRAGLCGAILACSASRVCGSAEAYVGCG